MIVRILLAMLVVVPSAFAQITSWEFRIHGQGIAVAGPQFSVKIDAYGNQFGAAYGSMSYERPGLQMYANVVCARIFQRGQIAAVVGNIARSLGGTPGGWLVMELHDGTPDRIRVTTSNESLEKLCAQPSGRFPGRFTSGGMRIVTARTKRTASLTRD